MTYKPKVLTVAEGGSGTTTSTGSGANVLATSPTLETPNLGTPSALVGTNITGTASGLSIGGNAATVTNGVYTVGTNILAGPMGIGATPVASAILQTDSTTQGFLAPRMTTAQMNAIASPAAGLQIFNTDLSAVCAYTGTFWSFNYSKFTTAVQSSTSTTYADVTELVTASLPAGRYSFEFNGISQSTAGGTGVGFRVAGTNIGAVVARWFISQAANGTAQNFQYAQLATTTNVTSASVTTANTDFPISGSGVFTLTTAGAVSIQIRTETNGTAISVRANSALRIQRMSA